MARQRILLLGLDGILAGIVRRALEGGPLELLGERSALDDRDAASVLQRATVVIVAGACATEATVSEILLSQPAITLLDLAGGGREASLVELWPRRRSLGELSASQLLRAASDEGTEWEARLGHEPPGG